MIHEYPYTLASNKVPKLNCPYCGAKKHWQRYFNPETGDVLPERYGACDNATKCGRELNPYVDGYIKMKWQQAHEQHTKGYKQPGTQLKSKLVQKAETVVFPPEVFKQTLRAYGQNVFLQNLLHRVAFPFETTDIDKVISLYYLGTICHGYRTGAMTLPYIDINGSVRTIQVKQFDEGNHTVSTDYIHSIMEKYYTKRSEALPNWLEAYKKQNKCVSCLFGEHLLRKYQLAPVALVEAPKTAVYCTLYFGFPDMIENYIWLAVYNKSSFTLDKMRVLQGRDVYVFPDLSKDGSTFLEWQQKAKYFEEQLPGTKFIFYDLLEQIAPDELKVEGADMADVLIKKDWREFRKLMIQKQSMPETKPGSILHETSCREKCEKCEPIKKTFFSQNDEFSENQVVTISSTANANILSLVNDKQELGTAPNIAVPPAKRNEKEAKQQTYGHLFDLLYARGHKTLPKNIEINISGWDNN